MTTKPLMQTFVRFVQYLSHSRHDQSSRTPDSQALPKGVRTGPCLFGRGPVASVLCAAILLMSNGVRAQETAQVESDTEPDDEIIYPALKKKFPSAASIPYNPSPESNN